MNKMMAYAAAGPYRVCARFLVGEDRQCLHSILAGADHAVWQIEHAQCVEGAEENGHDQRRFDHRQRDSDELLPGGCPVDLGCLIDLGRNGLQPGEGQQPDERSGLPGIGDDDRPERGPGIGEPENLRDRESGSSRRMSRR